MHGQHMHEMHMHGEHMRDSDVVASIVAGNPDGLAAAYDKYAGVLYGYCRSLLHEPDDAADAVQDTFVIAASRLGGLREPERLRAWLFAVARNECLRRLKSKRQTAPLGDAPEPADDSVDVGGEAERAEARALIRAAADGLNSGERDVINQLWHGLEVREVASVLGVSRNHAYSLFSRARDQLEASVGVLVVGRTGRKDCVALDHLLTGWDGRLTATLRKRIGRHIDGCSVCSDRKRQQLRPALLFGLTPGALLGLTIAHGSAAGGAGTAALAAAGAGSPFPVAAGATGLATPPAGLRETVLQLATDPGQHATTYRAALGQGTGPFHVNGFPKAVQHGHLAGLQLHHLPLAVAGGTAAAATAVVVVTAVVPHGRPAPPAAGGVAGTPVAGVATGSRPGGGQPGLLPGAATPSGGGTVGGSPGDELSAGTTGTAGTAGRPTVSGAASLSGTAAASVTAPGPTLGSLSASITAGPATAGPDATGPGASGSTASGAAATGTAASGPGATASASATVGSGTLSVSPTTVILSPLLGGTLTLTANGGPVSWSISEPVTLLGTLTLSASSGTLAAGQSASVQLTVQGLASLDTTLRVDPGGTSVTVLLGLA